MMDNDTKLLTENYDVIKEQQKRERLDHLDDVTFIKTIADMSPEQLQNLIINLKREYEFNRDLTRSMKSVMNVLYKRETLYYKNRLEWATKAMKRKVDDTL